MTENSSDNFIQTVIVAKLKCTEQRIRLLVDEDGAFASVSDIYADFEAESYLHGEIRLVGLLSQYLLNNFVLVVESPC